MKQPLLFLIIAITFLLASFRYAANPVKYTSTDGHYAIEFPGQPTESNEEDTTDDHKPFTIHFATYFPSDSEGYLADWVDMRSMYPKNRTLKQILEDSRDGAVRSVSATNVITTATFLGKEPYIEFSFTSQYFTGRGRIFVINKYQYSIITLFSLSKGIGPDADNFIKSFKHLN